MRIRSIKPEFWRSQDIKRLPWDTRLVFIGLWTYVDDNGAGRDELADITADLFAGDLCDNGGDTLARVAAALDKLEQGGLITRYIAADGRNYLHITGWGKHQRIDRPNKPRFPLPEGVEGVADVDNTRDCTSSGAVEQGNRGTGEVGAVKSFSAAKPRPILTKELQEKFDEFWAAYPRRTGKLAAQRAYIVAAKNAAPADILAGATRYARVVKGEDEKFIAHPSTWLNQGRWMDETAKPQAGRIVSTSAGGW